MSSPPANSGWRPGRARSGARSGTCSRCRASTRRGTDIVRVAGDGDQRWALAVVHPGAGPGALRRPRGDRRGGCPDPPVAPAGRRRRRGRAAHWTTGPRPPDALVHHQRFFTVDPDRVPDEGELPDPGLRPGRARRRRGAGAPGGAAARRRPVRTGPGPLGPARLPRPHGTLRRSRGWCGSSAPSAPRSARWNGRCRRCAGACSSPASSWTRPGAGPASGGARSPPPSAPRIKEGGESRPISLHVRAANTAAHHAYRAAGFVDREEWRLAVRP